MPGGKNMDHSRIDELGIAELYVTGQLAPEEAAAFEEHYLGCDQCLDRLETAEALRLGLRHAAAAQVGAAAVQLGVLARLSRLARSRSAALVAAGLLVAVLAPGGLLVRQGNELDRAREELGRARTELSQEKAGRRAAEARASQPAAGQNDRLEAERAAARQAQAALQATLETERQRRDELARELARAREEARRPQVNTPVVSLGVERSGPGSEPSLRMRIPEASGWVLFTLELDEPLHPRYRARLTGPDGRTLWEGTGLVPDAQSSLTLLLPSDLLAPGNFKIFAEGLPARGDAVPVGEFPFRAER